MIAGSGSGSDSDDDGIQVTIDQDKIEAAKNQMQQIQLKKSAVIDLGFVPSQKEKKGKFAVEEFETIGTINGQTAVEVGSHPTAIHCFTGLYRSTSTAWRRNRGRSPARTSQITSTTASLRWVGDVVGRAVGLCG